MELLELVFVVVPLLLVLIIAIDVIPTKLQQNAENRLRRTPTSFSTSKTDKSSKLQPPVCGQIHILRLPVQLDRDWQKAVSAAGPNTETIWHGDAHVREAIVANQYPVSGTGIVEKEIVLMNFGTGGGSWNRALQWGKSNGLKSANPRHVFTVSEYRPTLHYELEIKPRERVMRVLSTEECISSTRGMRSGYYRYVCGVEWDESKLGAHLEPIEDAGRPEDWFAFVRE